MPGLRSSMQRRAGYDLSFEGLPGTAVRAGSLRVFRLLEKHFQRWPFSLSLEGSSPLFTVKEKKNGFTVAPLSLGLLPIFAGLLRFWRVSARARSFGVTIILHRAA